MESNKLQVGYQYLYDNNLITNFLNYQFTECDINQRKISRIDEFNIILPDIGENIAQNIKIKLDLKNIAKNGSFTNLAEYIFELIIYVRGIISSHANPSCLIC
jgi:hypothetical protein